MEAFGKSGTKLLPMFADWNNLKAASAAAGALLTEEEVQRADALGDAFGAMQEAVSRLTQQVGAELAPGLQHALEIAIGFTATLSEAAGEMTRLAIAATQFALKSAVSAFDPTRGLAGALFERTGIGKGLSVLAGATTAALQARGHQAVAGIGDAGARARARAAMLQDDEAPTTTRPRSDPRADAAARALQAAHQRRVGLIREFETPEERFRRKDQELVQAIGEANAKLRVAQFPGQTQAALAERAPLEEARRRLHAQEAERRAAEARKRQPAEAGGLTGPRTPQLPERPDWAFDVLRRAQDAQAVVGFSGAALALGAQMGGGGPTKELLDSAKASIKKYEEMLVELREIKERTGRGLAVES